MPRQKPGRSRQCYVTPDDFIRAVEARFGAIQTDLAATAVNTKAKNFYTRRQDSLRQPWPTNKNAWLNPTYGNIPAWAKKCHETALRLTHSGQIFLLVPASVCSNWFNEHVWRIAQVNLLSPRLCFLGEHKPPYPKDLMLCVYSRTRPAITDQFCFWQWKKGIITTQSRVKWIL